MQTTFACLFLMIILWKADDNADDKTDAGLLTRMILIDSKKTFDTVNHDILLGKLRGISRS